MLDRRGRREATSLDGAWIWTPRDTADGLQHTLLVKHRSDGACDHAGVEAAPAQVARWAGARRRAVGT